MRFFQAIGSRRKMRLFRFGSFVDTFFEFLLIKFVVDDFVDDLKEYVHELPDLVALFVGVTVGLLTPYFL